MNRSTWVKNLDFDAQGLKVRYAQNNYYVTELHQENGPGRKKTVVHRDVGIVIPSGKIPLMDFSKSIRAPLKEYGFSQACLELLPLKWKNALGDDWFNVFVTIILRESENSYLADFPYESVKNRYLGSQRASMEAHIGYRLCDLFETFGGLMIATQNGVCVYMSQPTATQIESARKLGITLGGYVI